MASTKKDPFTISDTELAKELDVTPQRLDEIVDFFDSIPDDPWDLVENEDYIFTTKSLKIRRFSPSGALKIAYYLDEHEKYNIWHKIKDFLTQHSARLHKALACKVIYEELDDLKNKLIQVNGRSFLHKQSLRRILGTNGSRLNKALEDLRTSDTPLEPDVDFVEREFSDPKDSKKGQQLWFSGRGSIKISRELGEKLTDKARRKMCLAVSKQIQPVLDSIDKKEAEFKSAIDKVKAKAKTRDKVCQITRQKPNRYNKIQLSAHHLYCVKDYPHLALSLDNLITIDSQIHQEFHSRMGGYSATCTIKDFIDFVTERYPDQATPELMARLFQSQRVLRP
ncbi:MAG: hypothetical protein VKJ02_00280 [Snowella sp.]|nr:hypothetical protein [Snowella sp.]